MMKSLALLIIPVCMAEQILFFTNNEKDGIICDTGDGESLVKCSITSVDSSLDVTRQEIPLEDLNILKKYCNKSRERTYRKTRSAINIIVPETKWCGRGDIAKDDDDLGTKPVTDACCRAHDKCSPKIKAFKSIGSFRNYMPWTRLHCDCDDEFYNCLKDANNTEPITAERVGNVYFNTLSTKCFIETTKRKCVRYRFFRCVEYETVDTYKWVSNPEY